MDVGLDHPAVTAYLARLDAAAAGLPPGRREELMAEIRGHLQDSLAAAEHPDDATVLEVLDRLGEPEGIVAAEAMDTVAGTGVPAGRGGGWGAVEILAVAALTAGTFLLPIIGPLFGIVCAWLSPRWTRGEKVIATVLAFLPVVVLTLGVLSLIVVGSGAGGDRSVPVPVVVTATAPPVTSGATP